MRPRRIRKPECSAYASLDRWVNLYYAMNLTPDPDDNEVSAALGAWTLGDLPVSVAFQDVSDRGDDLLFVAIADRVYLLDWERFEDEWNWEAVQPIYRQLTLGPIPGSRDEQEGRPSYNLQGLKRFRKFDFQLAEDPSTDPISEYKISVREDGAAEATAATGYRQTQRHGSTNVAKKGYSFLVTLEHDANEDFPLLWWQAEWEELGTRRANDPVVVP
jgi:hypothetical protein